MIALAVAIGLALNAAVTLRWPHFTLNCKHGCTSDHDFVRCGNQGVLFTSLMLVGALALETLLP